jgi:transposase InsO family protein
MPVYPGAHNHRRLHEALGDIPPVEYELAHALAAPATPPREPRGR